MKSNSFQTIENPIFMKANEIRTKFLQFFENKKHKIVPSAPMVLKDDPTLLFTNAGMNQFKEYFLGNAKPKNKRVADTQKCLRVSGKHNDLEEVGKDTYHHTMFEMLGNWSFGDYFKKTAIEYAWELLTEVYKIPKENLYATVFEGDEGDGLEKDEEAYSLWKKILPEEQILLGNKEDNFWEMGDQGPCGPCSEIHIDIRSEEEKKKIPGRDLVNKDHPQVVEIWNLVFMQFNRKANGSLEQLPETHVDTGMGFERLCMVLQGKISNYDTDVFIPLIREIEKITDSKYVEGSDMSDTNIAIRVIADHVRAVAFAIADGQLPGNNGAGYVIRRILRRAIRYGFTFLNQKEAFIYKLINTLVSQMGDAFPELRKQQKLIKNVIHEEEQAFLKTLDQGLNLLDSVIENSKTKEISGKKAFELYDTFGFPIDLTALILEERGFTLNEKEFNEELQKQKDRSRSAAESITEDWQDIHQFDKEDFIGYDYMKSEVKIAKYRKITDKKRGEHYQLVFNRTPFYAEGGGQVGDQGFIENARGERIPIVDTKKENNLIIHFTNQIPENPEETFTAVVDEEKRKRTMANHTATHLLHQALREVLGKHVEQRGSLVSPERLRFDFSHFGKISAEEIKEIENRVNARIRKNLHLEEQREISFDKAITQGAIALFGEKYGDSVRTIRFGDSIELCGGTHVSKTGEIWYFKILGESGIASGVRRIEALTGKALQEFFEDQSQFVEELKTVLKSNQDPVKAVDQLQNENSELRKTIEKLEHEKAGYLKNEVKSALRKIDNLHFMAKKVDLNANGMKDLAYQLGGEVENLFLVLGAEQDGKALLMCYISKNLVEEKDLNAGKIVRELGKFIQGGGGGQAFFATAGGKKPEGIQDALNAAEKFIK